MRFQASTGGLGPYPLAGGGVCFVTVEFICCEVTRFNSSTAHTLPFEAQIVWRYHSSGVEGTKPVWGGARHRAEVENADKEGKSPHEKKRENISSLDLSIFRTLL